MNPLENHQKLLRGLTPAKAYRPGVAITEWQENLRAKLFELLALPARFYEQTPVQINPPINAGEVDKYRIIIQSEPSYTVPGFLLLPHEGKSPYPVMICLQGHASEGMRLSLSAEAKGGRDFARQALAHGWAALIMEQRGFGERSGDCTRDSSHALMLGRTLTGERVFDLMRALDFVESCPLLDSSRLACLGHSTGGTVVFYTACLDSRIRLAVVSGSYCTYADSWMKLPHCPCGYIPGILKTADMSDLSGLIAPRDLLIITGERDPITDCAGTKQAFSRTTEIYQALGYPERAVLRIGDGGHDFYPDLAWPEISRIRNRWNQEGSGLKRPDAHDLLINAFWER